MNFAEDLWDNFYSIETHFNNMRSDTASFAEWLKLRVDVELSYRKGLLKKMPGDFKARQNTTCKIFDDARSFVSASGEAHNQFAEIMKAISKSFFDLEKDLAKAIKEAKKAHDKAFKDRAEKEKDCGKYFVNYQKALAKADSCFDVHEDAKSAGLLKPIEKAQKAQTSAEKDLDKAYTQYCKSVTLLKTSQQNYDAILRQVLTNLQAKDEERHTVFAAEMKKFASAHDILVADVTSMQKIAHDSTSAADPLNDVQEFIASLRSVPFSPGYVTYVELQQLSSTKIGHGPQGPVEEKKVVAAPGGPPSYDKGAPAPAAAAVSGPVADALYDYQGQEGDLDFQAGDVISLISFDASEDWWNGSINGQTGIFPANYVQLRPESVGGAAAAAPEETYEEEAEEEAQPEEEEAQEETEEAQEEEEEGGGRRCRALYDFEAQGDDELSFVAGDVLTITEELPDWYQGELNGDSGIFPANYVELI